MPGFRYVLRQVRDKRNQRANIWMLSFDADESLWDSIEMVSRCHFRVPVLGMSGEQGFVEASWMLMDLC